MVDWRGARNRCGRSGVGGVIVITGPGRSGTSFLAGLYRELGFDPGGGWREAVNAGLEDKEFTEVNTAVAASLGAVPAPGIGPSRLRWVSRRTRKLPSSVRGPLDRAIDTVRYRPKKIDVIEWSRLDEVVEEFGPTMRSLAARTAVVKDPRFSWTMHAWLASGADVSDMVLALRPLDSMVTSRIRGGWIREPARTWATANFAYGIGLAVSAASQYHLPVHQLLFPQFLNDPEGLYRQLPLPEERTWEEFHAAFTALRDDSLVHE